jgi:hypothetical protein
MGSSKKAPAKAGKSVAATRKIDNRKGNEKSRSPSPSPSPDYTPRGKKKNDSKTWNYSHLPPKADEMSKNGRHEGRNLITWTRQYSGT